jgi:hypothetical protein
MTGHNDDHVALRDLRGLDALLRARFNESPCALGRSAEHRASSGDVGNRSLVDVCEGW